MSLENSLAHPISIAEVLKHHDKGDDCKPGLWDCGSQLYDSYELRTFKNQLNSAMVAVNSGLTSPCGIMQSPVYANSLASFLVTARSDKSRRKSQLQGKIKGHVEGKKQTENVFKNDDKMMAVWSGKAPKEKEGLQRKEKKKPMFVRLVKKVIKSFGNMKEN